MSWWTDFRDNTIGIVTNPVGALESGLNTVSNVVSKAVDSVIHNPVGLVVDLALLEMGVPPVYAGAAAGGANAAVNGGNILKGALTGGAMAGAAGYAGEFAGAQGLGSIGQAAASGAAAGATGAALTGQGLGKVVQGALTGGVMGGAVGYYQKSNGSITYTYDDGSTLTRNADGSYSSTAAGSIPAPVVDKSTYSTDKVNLSSSWAGRDIGNVAPGTVWTGSSGPEIVLDGGKVLPLDVYRAAVATGKPIFVDGVSIDPSFADIATKGQGNYYNQSNINQMARTPNTALATAEQINTGDAYYNPQAKAWETNTVNTANADSQYIPKSLTSTGISDSAPGTIYHGANGPEIVLDGGKTVNLAQYKDAVATGHPFTVDNQWQMQFRVEASGTPKYEGMAGAAPAPEGFKIAKPEDVFGPDDTHNAQNPYTAGAYLDPDTNTWYVPSSKTGEVAGPVAPGQGQGGGVGTIPNPAEGTGASGGTGGGAGGGAGTGTGGEGTTPVTGPVAPGEGQGTGTGAGGGAGGGDGTTPVTGPVIPTEPPVTNPPEVTPPHDATEIPHHDVPPEDTTTPTEDTTPPVTNPPVVPIVPVTPPVTPAPPAYTLHWGSGPISSLNTDQGLNPGWIQPVPQYQTTSPVQAQYQWGAHPFQAGPTFNAELAKQGPNVPVIPWGLQQMYQQLTPEETAALVHAPAYLQQLPGAPVAGPVAPR